MTDANLHEFVAGLVIVNDYSARDVQIPRCSSTRARAGPSAPWGRTSACWNRATSQDEGPPAQAHGERRGAAERFDRQPRLRPGGDPDRIFRPSGPVRRRPDRHGHARRVRPDRPVAAPAAPRGPASRGDQVEGLPEDAEQTRQYLKAGDVVEARIASASDGIDLGVQRNVVVEERA